MPFWSKKKTAAFPTVAAGPLAPAIVNKADAAEMILVPAGKFLRGSLEGQGDPDERPQREIYLDAYYIGKYPVTNQQYRIFTQATGYATPDSWSDMRFNHDSQPVVGVSWDDAQAYCQWAGLRLPTEAEWEKAASWDEQNKIKRWWPWGDTEPDPERVNYANNVGRTTPVGSLPLGASPYGCQDMAGNVLEWVQDWYVYNFYELSPAENPTGPPKEKWKVCRGGSFLRPTPSLTTTYRYWYSPSVKDNELGFRCAKSP